MEDTQLQRMRGPKHAPMTAESGFSSAFQLNALHMNGYIRMHLQLNANVFIHPPTDAGQHPWSTCTPLIHPSTPCLPCMCIIEINGAEPPTLRDLVTSQLFIGTASLINRSFCSSISVIHAYPSSSPCCSAAATFQRVRDGLPPSMSWGSRISYPILRYALIRFRYMLRSMALLEST